MDPLLVQQRSPIFRVPPEIRNCIWRYAVVIDRYVTFREYMRYTKSQDGLRSGNPEKLCPNDSDPRQTSMLAIAFTCRQLYLEVTPIYYGENTFHPDYYDYAIGSADTFKTFAVAIGSRNASSITDVYLDKVLLFSIDSCLKLLPNVKRLHFDNTGMGIPEISGGTMMELTQRHLSVTVLYEGEVWPPDKWKSESKASR